MCIQNKNTFLKLLKVAYFVKIEGKAQSLPNPSPLTVAKVGHNLKGSSWLGQKTRGKKPSNKKGLLQIKEALAEGKGKVASIVPEVQRSYGLPFFLQILIANKDFEVVACLYCTGSHSQRVSKERGFRGRISIGTRIQC